METFALKVPTGMKPSLFKPYAETFATKVLPVVAPSQRPA